MTQIDAIVALRSLDRPIVDRKGDGVAPAHRHDFDTTLHARPLLGECEFAAREVAAKLREQDRDLDREPKVAVQVLVPEISATQIPIPQPVERAGRSASRGMRANEPSCRESAGFAIARATTVAIAPRRVCPPGAGRAF